MNSPLDVKETLALLDTLKSVVNQFADREDGLERDFRSRSAAAHRALTGGGEAQEAAAAAQEAAAAAAWEAEKDKLQKSFDRRRARINRVHAAMSRRATEAISTCDEEWRERTQQGVQAAEVRRAEELGGATAGYEQFQQKLSAVEGEQARLETATRSAFRGYGRFRRMLSSSREWPEPDLAPDANALFAEMVRLQKKIPPDLARFKKLPLPLIFRFVPFLPLAGGLLGLAASPLLAFFGAHGLSPVPAELALAVLVAICATYFLGGRAAAPLAKAIAGDLAKARRLFEACTEKSLAHFEQEQERIIHTFEAARDNFNQEWRQAVRDIGQVRGAQPTTISAKASRLLQKNELWWHQELDEVLDRHNENLARLKAEDADAVRHLAERYKTQTAEIESDHQSGWRTLEADWKQRSQELIAGIESAKAEAQKLSPAWDAALWQNWTPPDHFKNAAQFGQLDVDVEKFAGPLPRDARLRWPGPPVLTLPLSLVSPRRGSILFETGKAGGDEAVSAINNIIFRLLTATPPGKLSFTIFDPVGLGQNFAALMHLADYEEGSINSRIWTQSGQFEERLAELNEHMEKIIQMYLRNEYATIAEYNAEAGSVAEKYHFLVIASFPVNFSDSAARRLRNIAANGARCGVFTLVQWDQRSAAPPEFVPDELRQNSVDLVRSDYGFALVGAGMPGVRLVLDPPPAAEFATEFLHRVGAGSKGASRVEVPFDVVAPAPADFWKEETTDLLRVPIGRSGATKMQYLEIGSGTRQHALIAGKTGSGKSTLFHIIITNLALRCSPEQVEFYLVDFKKGVEFKCYANRKLPHARVVAIESDREFGLSVLQRVDEELRRRGDLFRNVGAQDLAGYKRAGGTEAVPRTLLMIDEFQEFFTEEDRVSQGAAVLLDRIVRQGRAFGVHVLLGSQTLGGAYTLARATIGQMVIRIALQCNEADAYLIMDQDNPAPRLLSRPGEGIYNDEAGAMQGNSPFQAVWLSDKTRDLYLAKIRKRADEEGGAYPGPLVFEGNAPAEVRENVQLLTALTKIAAQSPPQASVWLGAPNSIKGPTEAVFRRQSGSNLLVVGQSEERTTTILAVALVSLATQIPRKAARFVVLDNTPPGFPQRDLLERVVRAVPHEVALAGNSHLAEMMDSLAEELKRRGESESSGPQIFVLIQGLQNFRKLRQEDEFSFSSSRSDAPNPAATLLSLITEGPGRGIHVIATCDTYNNVSRCLGRKTLGEFEMRVVFQMSASDSASLIETPAAGTLGLNRALFYNDREGSLETFRPYAPPDSEWVESVSKAPAFA